MVEHVFLEYTFMFDPSKTWAHMYEFEQTFSKYLESIGFEAEKLRYVDGGSGRKMLLIRKKEDAVLNGPVSAPMKKAESLGVKIREMGKAKK